MPSLRLDPRLTRAVDRVRSRAYTWHLRAAIARAHTADLRDDNRHWQHEARTPLERTLRLRHTFLPRVRAERVGTA